MKEVNAESNKKTPGSLLLKIFFLVGMLSFLIYGLSFFISKPTGETITTHVPVFNNNQNQMRDVDFRKNKR